MDYASLLRRFARDNVLHTVLVELTYACNLDCFFCYNDRGIMAKPLAVEEYCRLFEDLREMQVMNLAFTGGEPLAHPDFFEIGHKARELGFVIRVKTNGHALRGDVARRLKEEIDPFQVDVSIHGARPETHDRQTRVAGSFRRLLANVRELRDRGFRLKLSCVLTRWNEDEVDEMYELADSLGVGLAINPSVSPRDDGSTGPLEIEPTSEGLVRLHRAQGRRAKGAEGRSPTPADESPVSAAGDPPSGGPERVCGAGSSAMTIDPWGGVLPCVQWRRPVGNLRETSMREIWESAPLLTEIRRLTVKAATVVRGHDPSSPLVGFCPGLAELATGDPLTPYPALLREVAARRAAEERTRSEGAAVPSRVCDE